MDQTTRHNLLKVILALSIAGVLISLYLVKNHYDPPLQGAFCDLGETLSCSYVNTSIYSVLFGVPVALLGALWFLFLLSMSWKALHKEELVPIMVGWNVLGILFVIYMIIAEFILKAICLLCTITHIIVAVTLSLSLLLYLKQEPPVEPGRLWKATKRWIWWSIILFGGTFILFNITGEQENYDALTQCMTEKGVKMYSSFRCGVCARTKSMLGRSFKYVAEIECHPQGPNPQTDLCIQKNIPGTPTWTIEINGMELKRHTGFLSIDELREFSGCKV